MQKLLAKARYGVSHNKFQSLFICVQLCEVDPLFSQQRLGAEVFSLIQENDNTKTLVLRPGKRWKGFKSGQYVSMELDIEGIRTKRNYSISSSPKQFKETGLFNITVKEVEGGKVSCYLNQHIHTKATLYISEAKGDFTLNKCREQTIINASVKPLFIAAGSGVTPIMSMIEHLQESESLNPFTLIYYVNTKETMIFGERLKALSESVPAFTFIPHYTNEEDYICSEQLVLDCPDILERYIYLCGPQTFMDATLDCTKSLGIAEESIQYEQFSSPNTTVFNTRKTGQIQFMQSGKVLESNGDKTLLELAELSGLKPKYGCRNGICCECKCERPTGQLINSQTGKLIPAEQSHIQTCISIPVGDVSIGAL